MIDRLDDLVKRFVAVFLFPLMNIIALGLILYFCTKQNIGSIFSSQNLQQFVAYILTFFSGLLESGFTPIIAFVEKYKEQIQSLSFFVMILVVTSFVIVLYVIDRLVFYIGLILPPAFDFDINAYAVSFKDSERSKLLLKALGAERDLSLWATYGFLRAYLGERNRDPFRIAFRDAIVKSIDSIKYLSYYVKAYLFIALIPVIAAPLSSHLSFGRACGVVLILFVGLLVLMGYHARRYRQLVEYDVDSFIWDRCYNSHRVITVLSLPSTSPVEPEAPTRLKRIAARRFLKISWSEIFS